MLGKIYTDAKLRMGSTLREWKEKREEQKAQKQAAAAVHSEHGHGRFFLLTVPATATICAAIVEVYWAFLFCIEATGHLLVDWSTSVGSDTAASGAWHFAFTVNSVAVLIGLVCATIPIVMISMVWLPVQFTMRGTGRWRRGTMIFCGLLANLLVIVSGTVVMNGNRQEQVREGAVVEQTAAQGRAAIDARLAFEQEQLRLALANSNPYLNQAANVGAAEWERSYVAQARATNDPRLPQLERALGAARAADERRANIERLTVERATAAPEAATATNVEDEAGATLNQFSQAVQVWRPPFVAFICTLVGIFGAWWTLALMQGLNPRDVLRSGWADEGHRIEDLREQEAIVPERDEKGHVKMKPPRRVFTEADTGEEIEQTLVPQHYRTIKRGKRTRVETNPDIPPDETGVPQDGGNRTAVTLGGEMELPSSAEDRAEPQPDFTNQKHGEHDGSQDDHSVSGEVSSLREDEAQSDEAKESDGRNAGLDISAQLDSSEELPVFEDEPNTQTQDQEQEQREPETDPARLIAAE